MIGCCGCSLTASTVTACIFGMVESLVMLIVNSVFLNAYYSVTLFSYYDSAISAVAFRTRDSAHTVEGLLITAALLNCTWFIASVVTLIANAHKKAVVLKVWVGVTVVIIVTDILFTIVLIAVTVAQLQSIDTYLNTGSSGGINNQQLAESANATVGYALLICNFGRFGLVGLIINIFLALYTYRRAQEIERGGNLFPTGVVTGYAQPAQGYPGGVIQVQQYPVAGFQQQGQQYPQQDQQYPQHQKQ